MFFAAAACAVYGSAAAASEVQALCGGVKCTVSITPDLISSPYGQIPPARVTYWGSSGDSKTSVGTGVATTILFGGIGLLGFLAKNHQYNFTINSFDAEGKKASMQIEFKNDKPAKQLMSELTAFTGLGMGQTRTAEEILAAEQGAEPTLETLGSSKEETILGPKGTKNKRSLRKTAGQLTLRTILQCRNGQKLIQHKLSRTRRDLKIVERSSAPVSRCLFR